MLKNIRGLLFSGQNNNRPIEFLRQNCGFLSRDLLTVNNYVYKSSNSPMAKYLSSCLLSCLQRSHDPIPLPDGERVVIGRSPITQIVDPRCSRNQIELIADWDHRTVKIKQLGANSSTIDGKEIGHNKESVMNGDSTLFILSGQYPHRVVFECDPKKGEAPKVEKAKRKEKAEEADENETKTSAKRPGSERSFDHSVGSSSKNSKKETGNDHSSSKSKKRPSTETRNDHHIQKKIKTMNFDASEKAGKDKKAVKFSEHKCRDSDEEQHVADVAARLEEMKKAASSSVVSSEHNGDMASKNSRPSKESSYSRVSSSSRKSSSVPSSPLPSSAAAAEYSTWINKEHLSVFTSKGVKARSKIAGFDIDGTIVVSRSGKTFPTDENDWKILYPEIFGKLKSLHAEKYKIVFFTNQLGVARGKIKLDALQHKIANIVAKLQVPIQVFIATHEGQYRKPSTGMWKKLKHDFNSGLSTDLKSSIYVGDAAGRPADWAPKKKKDFSCSDRLFALNIGVTFKTPEEFFLKQKPAPFIMPDFDPRKLKASDSLLNGDFQLTSSSKEVIILVGFPASGKSHFAQQHLKPKGYVVINRDTLGTWQKCVKTANEALVNSSVVIDNTNLSREERARYIECASKANVQCRCFVFTTTVSHCRHNERFRQLTDNSHAKINEILFNQAKSKYQEPNMSEGFTEIVNVNFVPSFSSSTAEKEYRNFLLEK